MQEISVPELVKINNPLIIDIRNKTDFSETHIPNSINIPYLELITSYDKRLNKFDNYYLCCDIGQKGREVAYYLYLKGYNTINIIGGLEAYKNYKNL